MTCKMKMRFISNELSYNFSILLILYDNLSSKMEKNQDFHLEKSTFLIALSYNLNKIPKLYDSSGKISFLHYKNVI